MSKKIKGVCERCGKPTLKYPSRVAKSGRNFCSRQCNMATMNGELNPTRMTPEVREKLRNAHLGSGEGKSYPKYYGRHAHRVEAEKMLGRPLRKGEIVHHKDNDKRNYDQSNLEVLASQSEHINTHREDLERGKSNGS